jgi:hypothetical protein
MGEKKFTFIELHLDGDTQFGPRAIDDALPFGEKGDLEADEDAELEDETAEEDDSGGKGAIGALIALAVLVALGVAAKKYVGDDDDDELEEFEAADEPDIVID